MASATSVSDETCPVCHDSFLNTKIYAIGHCDHPVCYRCSTRMRALCNQMYCSICRAELPKVLFITRHQKFDDVVSTSFCINNKFKIFYENLNVKLKCEKLLTSCCNICNKDFQTFRDLTRHMSQMHSLFPCDLCVKHFNLFSSERKFYDRKKLVEHKRVGDSDDSSHKGHPICQFCDIRYLDKDDLVIHLRKDHYYCHFCHNDGLSNEFFSDYSFLRKHFRQEHYLCESDDCAKAQFINAFKTDIDLKAHKNTFHFRNLNKLQAKKLRNIDIEFNFPPRPISNRRRVARGEIPYNDQEEVFESSSYFHSLKVESTDKRREDGHMAMAIQASLQETSGTGEHQHIEVCPIQATTLYEGKPQDFPSLAGDVEKTENRVFNTAVADTFSSKTKTSCKISSQNSSLVESEFPLLTENFRFPKHSLNLQSSWGREHSSLSKKQSCNHNNISATSKPHKTMLKKETCRLLSKPVADNINKSKTKSSNKSRSNNLSTTTEEIIEDEFPALLSTTSTLDTHNQSKAKQVIAKGNENNSKSKINECATIKHVSGKNILTGNGHMDKESTTQWENNFFKDWIQHTGKNGTGKPEDRKLCARYTITETSALVADADNLPTTSCNIKSTTNRHIEKISEDFSTLDSKSWSKKSVALPVACEVFPSNVESAYIAKSNTEEFTVKDSCDRTASHAKQKQGCATLKEVMHNLTADTGHPHLISNIGYLNGSQTPSEVADGTVLKESSNNKCNGDILISKKSQYKRNSKSIQRNNNLVHSEITYSKPEIHHISSTECSGNSCAHNNWSAPPGFNSIPNLATGLQSLWKCNSSGPPPGFPFSRPCWNEAKSVSAEYMLPSDSLTRNKQLFLDMATVLTDDCGEMDTFMDLSHRFRQNMITSVTYNKECLSIFGCEAWKRFLPELITLLPDIPQQWMLVEAIDYDITSLTFCSSCGQILQLDDVSHHQLQHNLDNEYPSLEATRLV